MIVVSLALRVPRPEFEAFRPVIEELVKRSREELGVVAYSFAIDIVDPELIRIFEVYRDQAALDSHMATAHFQAWRPASAPYTRAERRLFDATLR
jgi:quinol monooxygenase YgiN